MPLPLSVAKATKNMPAGKGTYGSKRGRPAKKKTAAKGKKGLPPALAKKAAEMKGKKAPAKGGKKVPAFLKKKSAKK